MANGSAASLRMTTLDDDAWDDLLSFIEERRVIPIVGPELLMVATERGPRLLFDWVAEKLAPRLNVHTAELPQPYTLNDVICLFLAGRGRREEAYVRLRSIIKDANFEPPLALRQLAAITDFDLFVSTTADSLLESAINLERFAGAASTDVLSYCPNRVIDLPVERDREALPPARAQPPALHREQLHELAGAAVSAHGEASAPLRPARCRRGAGGRSQQPGRSAGLIPSAGQRAYAHLRGRRAFRRGAARTLAGAAQARG
ncbi:MAG: hypothetical protein E6K39_20720, partial [Gammaproteobacteria bacterium]